MIIDWILQLITYNPESPFQFIHLGFWFFLGVVLLVNAFLYNKIILRNSFLYLASLFFYYKTGGLFFILLIVCSLIGYYGGKIIETQRKQIGKQIAISLSISLFLIILGYFKYAPFLCQLLTDLFNKQIIPFTIGGIANDILGGKRFNENFLLPIGISFFTFQGISYLVDVYRGKIASIKNVIDFGFYVSFFPQVVSGPIVRAWEFIPQLYNKVTITERELWQAVLLILGGVFKKIVLSDYIASNLVDRIFASPESYTGFENLLGVIGYTIQIYADFSGYTDIAIGVALLIGFKLPINFNSPYKATSITDFWRRWHISLSQWLRDYLYIPLGGNRKGKIRQGINLLITMLLGGLWHGASIKFIIWGGLHGVALISNKLFNELEELFNFSLPKWIGWVLTFIFINLTWILFRANDMECAQSILFRITNAFSTETIIPVLFAYKHTLIIIALGYILHWLSKKREVQLVEIFIKSPTIIKVFIIVIFVISIYQFTTTAVQPFIYFKF